MALLPIHNRHFAELFFGCFRMRPRSGQIDVPIVASRLGKHPDINQGALRPRNARLFARTVAGLFETIPQFPHGRLKMGGWGVNNLAGQRLFINSAGGDESIILERDEKENDIGIKLGIRGLFSEMEMGASIQLPQHGRPKVQVDLYEINFTGPAIMSLLIFLRLSEQTAMRSVAEALWLRLGLKDPPKFFRQEHAMEHRAGANTPQGFLVLGFTEKGEMRDEERMGESLRIFFQPHVRGAPSAPPAFLDVWNLASRLENRYPVDAPQHEISGLWRRYQRRIDALYK